MQEDETPARKPILTLDQLLEGTKNLPQRTVHALSNCFALLTAASVFWLALNVMENPTQMQLMGLGGYAVFVLIINWVVRK